MALVSPGCGGTITSGMPRSRARYAACSGPAPPNASSAKRRGSSPRLWNASRRSTAMLVLTILRMPAAAVTRSRPSGRATPSMIARSARPRSSAMRPPSTLFGSERAEHQIGVGHGRRRAAAAVAGRARHGAGALRADLHQSVAADPGDGAAAGAERVHRQHRRADILAGDAAARWSRSCARRRSR